MKPIGQTDISQRWRRHRGFNGMHLILDLGMILKFLGERYFKRWVNAKNVKSSGKFGKIYVTVKILSTPGSCHCFVQRVS